jgi:hypothetical protein
MSDETTSEETVNATEAITPQIIVVQIEGDGKYNVNPINVDATSVPVILRIVARQVEKQMVEGA